LPHRLLHCPFTSANKLADTIAKHKHTEQLS
jgi:hypothetical protein